MDDSDEYGDLDDSAFIEAATQAEQTAFPPSPRPAKRQKISHQGTSIPPRQHNNRNSPIPDSEEEDDDVHSTFSPESETSRDNREHSHSPLKKQPSHSPSKFSSRSRSKSRGKENGTPGAEDGISKYIQKKRDRIHMPTTAIDLTDVFYTQPPQEHSPPWKPRGAIWQKPTLNIGVHRPGVNDRPSKPEKWTGLDTMKTMALPGRQSIVSRPSPQEYDPVDDLADLPSDAFASSPSSPQKQDDDVVLVSESRRRLVAPQTNLRQTTLYGQIAGNVDFTPSQTRNRYNYVAVQREEEPTHHKLDLEAMKTWVYPTNLGVLRDYQFNIVARGLYHNTLVALPTGLGKTFIAATIMLNWFRWTTEAQIVFVAPTRPLVAQQVDACFKIAGIPRSQTTMLMGGVAPGLRAEEWKSKRVFFMTPQTMLLDLKSGIADPKKIVLLVVDEAHRATGSYAYVEVANFLHRFNKSFRVLALTATPGSDVESVQKVIDGLKISRIEIRTEKSLDLKEYVHQRNVEKKIFKNSEEMEMCMELYSAALSKPVKMLAAKHAFWSSDPLDLTPYGCTQARQKWMAGPGRNVSWPEKSQVNSAFAILASISHGMEMLKYHSIVPFYTKMKEFRDDAIKSNSKMKKEIANSDEFKKLMNRLQQWTSSSDFVGHPKLDYLQQVILDHFLEAGEGRHAEGAPPSQTRVMVFAHWRDSAEEIVRVLKKHQPMIRPHVFVGQASAKNSEGMAQKDQLEMINKFQSGVYNTLVATSIGEEGLDIGEVDLIVCYDSKASPLRMLQRMGRTGRKRQGRIVLLQMEGKEERDFEKAKDSYERMQELIANGSQFTFHEELSKRIVPAHIQPVVDKRAVEIPLENSQSDWEPLPKKKNGRAPKRPPKKFHMPDGVITGFVKANRMDEEIAPKSRGKKKADPVYPSEEIYEAVPLETVLLDEKGMKDLEQRFQTVYDDDDAPVVGPLQLDRYPARQRVLSRPKLFRKPGRMRKSFVETLQRMHAMDDRTLESLVRPDVHLSDFEDELGPSAVISDTASTTAEAMAVDDDMWASDDPPSQPVSKAPPKTKPAAGRKPKKTTASKLPASPRAPAPRGRATKSLPESATPTRRQRGKPSRNTSAYQISELVEEGASSSPPPTDPRMRLASQAIDLGSHDTSGEEDVEDTQAYLNDSFLRSFIADDDEEVDAPESSLPSLNFGPGKGTQAVVQAAKSKKPRRMEKIFTSDPTDVDVVMSSDSEDETPARGKKMIGLNQRIGYTVDSDEDQEDDGRVLPPTKRVRRVIDDDDDDDE
ncbi:P-loop containing nucleoside triphosphate hydrolase protein [Westerdykella ornata]|uniref:ATP-dependent DNA helicase n=1 Tax=Westerdykella ornata TaxID=318751 RepID=A0A6A6JNY8_WESOR|nr:P-loop containing nucleoside triphosphate hydrolase protein [Westerdykella ornata]KAF2277396.1 P-loop containing nucleoside triphosphate hydrolase protein [Westerdykella ornata]